MEIIKMQIYNLHTKDQRHVEDLKVVAYEEFDKNGKRRNNRYVQYTVIGNGDRTWIDFMTIKDFKRLNPNITIIGLN